MNIKVRQGVFETNSSSSHSFTSGNGKVHIPESTLTTIVLGSGDYGWGYETLTYWSEKADYLAVEARDDEWKDEKLREAIKMAYPDLEIVYSQYGYIDHQSSGDIWSYLNSANDVYTFLFDNSEIEIDNDNH